MSVSHKAEKIAIQKNVYDAAVDRIEWVFNTFPGYVYRSQAGKALLCCFTRWLKSSGDAKNGFLYCLLTGRCNINAPLLMYKR